MNALSFLIGILFLLTPFTAHADGEAAVDGQVIAGITLSDPREKKKLGYAKPEMVGAFTYNEENGPEKVDVGIYRWQISVSKGGKELFRVATRDEHYVDSMLWTGDGRLLITVWRTRGIGAGELCLLDFRLTGEASGCVRELRYQDEGLCVVRVTGKEEGGFVSTVRLGVRKYHRMEALISVDQLKVLKEPGEEYPVISKVVAEGEK